MNSEKITLVVEFHGSGHGNYTLVRYDPGKTLNSSLEQFDHDLTANNDPATFYRAVAAHMARMVLAGESFDYDDVPHSPSQN